LSEENVIKIYGNEDVKRIIAFIPPGHLHARMIIELRDQTIVLQEATIAGIIRAYANVALHPRRRAIELIRVKMTGSKKPMFAEHQLVESGRSEEEVLNEACRMYYSGYKIEF